jgi:hypothetical protein
MDVFGFEPKVGIKLLKKDSSMAALSIARLEA